MPRFTVVHVVLSVEYWSVYAVIDEPLFAGAVQLRVAALSAEELLSPDGALGTVNGAIAALGVDADPEPAAFEAVTVNV